MGPQQHPRASWRWRWLAGEAASCVKFCIRFIMPSPQTVAVHWHRELCQIECTIRFEVRLCCMCIGRVITGRLARRRRHPRRTAALAQPRAGARSASPGASRTSWRSRRSWRRGKSSAGVAQEPCAFVDGASVASLRHMHCRPYATVRLCRVTCHFAERHEAALFGRDALLNHAQSASARYFNAGPCELRLGVYESFDTLCIYLESDSLAGDPERNFWVKYRCAELRCVSLWYRQLTSV